MIASHSEVITYKTCFHCNTIKPLCEFYKHNGMKDGHLNKCKQCTKGHVSKNYKKNINHYKEYELHRKKLPQRFDQRKKYCNNWRKNNPEKYKAQTNLNNAVKYGRITKKPCQVCGDKKSHGHHEDYSKPLDVIWLCAQHHRDLHSKKER